MLIRKSRLNLRVIAICASILIPIIVLYRLLYPFLPGGDGILARITTPEGIELCVIQKSNYSFEPYTVSFYFKRPGQLWGWFYYEHQDTRWDSGSIELNSEGTVAIIKRGASTVAMFDLVTERFSGKYNTIQGAQLWLPVGWTPEEYMSGRKAWFACLLVGVAALIFNRLIRRTAKPALDNCVG